MNEEESSANVCRATVAAEQMLEDVDHVLQMLVERDFVPKRSCSG